MGSKNNQQLTPGFVPPPPPQIFPTVQVPQPAMFGQGGMMPQYDLGRTPVQLPPFPQADLDSVKSADLGPMKSTLAQQQDVYAQRQKDEQDVAQQFMPNVLTTDASGNFQSTIPQSANDQFMSDQIKGQLMKELAGGNSAMSRFQDGASVGQMIGANLLAPMLGVFSKAPGAAMGANQATQQLQMLAQQAQQQQQQHKQQHNQNIINLSQAFQNMDPNSSKRIGDLIGKQVEINKAQWERQRQAQQATQAAQHDVQQSQAAIAQQENTQAERQTKVILEKLGYGEKQANLDLQNNNGRVQDTKDLLSIQKGVDTTNAQLQQQANQLNETAGQNRINNSNTEDASQEKALKDLQSTVRLISNAATDTAGGAAKRPGYAQIMAQNPILAATFAKQLSAAGINNLHPEDVFNTLIQHEQQGQQQQGGDLLGGIPSAVGGAIGKAGEAIGGALNSAGIGFSKGQPAQTAQPSVTVKLSPQEAYSRWSKKNPGKTPTSQDLMNEANANG